MEDKFGFDTSYFLALFGYTNTLEGETNEKAPQDVFIPSYNIPGVGYTPLKVLDTSYLIQGVDYFRPYIRGFLILLTFLYHVKMVLSFFKQDIGMATTAPGRSADKVASRAEAAERRSKSK